MRARTVEGEALVAHLRASGKAQTMGEAVRVTTSFGAMMVENVHASAVLTFSCELRNAEGMFPLRGAWAVADTLGPGVGQIVHWCPTLRGRGDMTYGMSYGFKQERDESTVGTSKPAVTCALNKQFQVAG